jgi:hypothetical protein
MDDERNADVYFVERNAGTDHRTPRPTWMPSTRAPAYVPPASFPTGTRVTYGGPASFAGPSQFAGPAQFAPQAFWGGNQPVYMQPPAWGWGGQPGTLGGLFAGLNGINLGTLVDLAGQGFAAIRSLPTPPTSSGDSGTDVANLTLYQQALAEHGKTDEQIRTAVHILAKLLGA